MQETAASDPPLTAHPGPMAMPAGPVPRYTALVRVDSLTSGDSPRISGINAAYAQMLADLENDLPPILVHRPSMQVIDGMHRLRAARLRGRANIRVQFCDCDHDEAFLLAVAANTTHGMPLTITEKRAAAARIVRTCPDASNRWIAQLCGLAAATIAAIRHADISPSPAPARRIGRDGRTRPLNAAGGRELARDILTCKPDASLRQVARQAGISAGTVRDVKNKMRLGIDPVSTQKRKPRQPPRPSLPARNSQADFTLILDRLRRDPSLRYTETGRTFLRWLHPRLLQKPDWENIIDNIPPRWITETIRIARTCAAAWTTFAEQLEQRDNELSANSPTPSRHVRIVDR